jgi:hypothetical protein
MAMTAQWQTKEHFGVAAVSDQHFLRFSVNLPGKCLEGFRRFGSIPI